MHNEPFGSLIALFGWYHGRMNYDDELKKAAEEMNEAEDTLAQKGFPVDQWMLIKQYIGAAIIHNTVTIAKTLAQSPGGVIVTED